MLVCHKIQYKKETSVNLGLNVTCQWRSNYTIFHTQKQSKQVTHILSPERCLHIPLLKGEMSVHFPKIGVRQAAKLDMSLMQKPIAV